MFKSKFKSMTRFVVGLTFIISLCTSLPAQAGAEGPTTEGGKGTIGFYCHDSMGEHHWDGGKPSDEFKTCMKAERGRNADRLAGASGQSGNIVSNYDYDRLFETELETSARDFLKILLGTK